MTVSGIKVIPGTARFHRSIIAPTEFIIRMDCPNGKNDAVISMTPDRAVAKRVSERLNSFDDDLGETDIHEHRLAMIMEGKDGGSDG